MTPPLPFGHAGRIPAPGDNVAIAVRRLEAGTLIQFGDLSFHLPHTILEGHRFAIVPIQGGEPLLSWGLPFGFALREIGPGGYVCNDKILWALRQRHVDFALPSAANFRDHYVPYQFDESRFQPGSQVAPAGDPATFEGFARSPDRGVGTRNYIAILGTTSRTASFARALAERFKDVSSRFPNIDGVVAIAHTEGGGTTLPNNLEFLLRTLAGFMVHPNLGAVLAVDLGIEPVNNGMLERYVRDHGYPLDDVPHRFWTLRGNFLPALEAGEAIVKGWLERVNGCQRTSQSVEHLKIGLQCGGSDAFSGVSGNPLAGWVTKELLRLGGSANLAETDELIGAEPYILANVKDLATARAFLKQIERFQERAGWHGHTGEGNPSGGNNYRGLYNIAVKSIGAARKKDPEVRLDYVIDYGQRMRAPGFYFMDSPGNDLESIAGQVAAGCNLILFTTGNGSITNFPFVPTLKIMTNTGRFELLRNEMDVNAGRYLDGTPMEELGRETFALTLRVASGERSVGEKAGHSQVQLWRDWRQTSAARLDQLLHAARPSGEPLTVKRTAGHDCFAAARFQAYGTSRGFACDQVGLIIPTSLCSGEIGRLIAGRLNDTRLSPKSSLSRFVALAHTEGCGVSSGESEEIHLRTMAGYLCHPSVARGLLLEHGCEKTHNDAMRNFLAERGLEAGRVGFASVQLDGGIENVAAKVIRWFQEAEKEQAPVISEVGLAALRLGILASGEVPERVAIAFAQLAGGIVQNGGTVVLPQNSSFVQSEVFARELLESPAVLSKPTLAYGQNVVRPGLHVMETPTDHLVETLTGLGATGVDVMIAFVEQGSIQGHPMIPLLQIGSREQSDDLDLGLELSEIRPEVLGQQVLELVLQTAGRAYAPKLCAQGNTDFQITRGFLGVSL